jgi:hypothetical protein
MLKQSDLLILILIVYSSSLSATVTPIQELDFGVVVVTNNNSIAKIQIDPAGNTQVTGGLAVISGGNNAIYELSDLEANRTFDVDVDVINSEMISETASEETFSLSILRNSTTVFTDNSGTALLFFGGEIQTSGNSSEAFTDTRYNSTIQITINL